MNAKLRIAVLALPILGLAACATTDDRTMYSPPPAKAPSIMDNDAAYVDYVERVARRRGIEVMWVNMPRSKHTIAQVDD